MVKKKKNVQIIVIVLIAIIVIFFLIKPKPGLLATVDVSGAQLERTFPGGITIESGSVFQAEYDYVPGTVLDNVSDNWGVLWDDHVTVASTGSCTCDPTGCTTPCTPSTDIECYYDGKLSPSSGTTWPQPRDFIANGTDGQTCEFSGFYEFASGISGGLKSLNSLTITICVDECATGEKGCYDVDTKWDCGMGPDLVCYDEISSICPTGWDCYLGDCTDCNFDELKIIALQAILTWAGSGDSGDRAIAIQAIMDWAIC